MRRITASATADQLTITRSRAALLADIIANLVVAVLAAPLASMIWLLTAFSSLGSLWLIGFIPSGLFLWMAGIGIVWLIIPPRIVFDVNTGALSINGKTAGRIADLQGLRVVFTGRISPSRYALVADLPANKSVRICSTGYTGSREELRQLSQVIADFTGRFDLYAR